MLNKLTFFAILLSGCLNISGQEPSPSPSPERYTVQGYSGAVNGSGPTKGAISGGVLNGKAAALPPPVYPRSAMAVRAEGAVAVQVLIDEEGKVISASAVSGNPLLRAAAVAAAKGARFSPTKLDGRPVKVSGIIVYNFVGPEKPEQIVMGLGYDLADGEITRSLSVDAIKRSIPSGWQEEKLLLEKIAARAGKYEKENPAKFEMEDKPEPPAKPELRGEKIGVNSPPGDPNTGTSYTGPISTTNRYTIVGRSDGHSTQEKGTVNISPETSADLAELQKMIIQRFAGNEMASWYFRYGQTLAALRGPISDETRFSTAIRDLRVLIANIPASADNIRPRLDKLVVAAEAAHSDVSMRPELLALITESRSR